MVRPRFGLKTWLQLLAMMLGMAVAASSARAQSTRVIANTAPSGINLFSPCLTPIVRNFTVPSNFIIGDVDLGMLATHARRGDIRVSLQSPAGTRQQLVSGDLGLIGGSNFNVRLNDAGVQVVNTDDPFANHSAAPVPLYQHSFIPDAPLSAFNGQHSGGTWRLEICDGFPLLSDGNYIRSDLYLTPQTNASGTGATFVVTNTADSGSATLRQAIGDANATPTEADTIAFAIPGAGPHTITLTSALPIIADSGALIDGTTQPGSQCHDLWAGTPHVLRVNLRGAGFDGLRPAGANQTIKGLSISGFINAVAPQASSINAAIQCNFIGLLANGTSNANTTGVNISGAGTRIGGLDAGDGNVISGNAAHGVLTNAGSVDTAVRGNFIGTDTAGMSPRANGLGISHQTGAATWRDITWNLISGNLGAAGIALNAGDSVTPSTDLIRIQRNRIGFNRTFTALLRNSGHGIGFSGANVSNVMIGGDALADGNDITGSIDGVSIIAASDVIIHGNTIAQSVGAGVRFSNVVGGAIGGDAAVAGNIISGNGTDGIALDPGTSGITIQGNTIGLATIAGSSAINGSHGIVISTASNITIGAGSAAARNIISGNGRRAITAIGTNANITINGNFIGTDASGNMAVTNGQNEIAAFQDAIAFDFNTISNLAILNNVIGGYQAALIKLNGGTGTGVVIQGNNLGVGADGSNQIVSDSTDDLVVIGGSINASSLLIGGDDPAQRNIIAFSGQNGLRLDSVGTNIQVIGNTIRNNALAGVSVRNLTRAAFISNRIFANGQIGIDLGANGVTPNDAGDADIGPNELLNFPQIIAAIAAGGNALQYHIQIDVPATTNGYRIEFFADSAADISGFGEGEVFLGHVDIIPAGGVQTFSGTLATLGAVNPGDRISATTTRRNAGGTWDITSEFAAVAAAQGSAQLTVEMTSQVFDPVTENSFTTPGNDVLLITTITNTGSGSTDIDSIFAVVSIGAGTSLFNDVTPILGGIIGFSTSAPALSFAPETDLRFSDSAAAPSSLTQCNYVPTPGYDSQIRHVCLNPKGTLPNGAPTGQFAVRLRARVN